MRVRTRKSLAKGRAMIPELPGQIGDFFRRLEIAEAVIGESFSTRAAEPSGLFMRCKIPGILEGLSIDLYQAHVREVVETEATTGAPLCGLSDAEILGIHYTRSLRGPLLSEDVDLYLYVFAKAFPGQALPIEASTSRMTEVLARYAHWKAQRSPRLLE